MFPPADDVLRNPEGSLAEVPLGLLLRGLSDGVFTGRTQSTVGIYLDDTPITYNAPDPDLRLTDVQRVDGNVMCTLALDGVSLMQDAVLATGVDAHAALAA